MMSDELMSECGNSYIVTTEHMIPVDLMCSTYD